jgi:hypothetical protein
MIPKTEQERPEIPADPNGCICQRQLPERDRDDS